MEIKSQRVALVAMKPEDKDGFFALATQSEGSRYWYDEEEKEKRSKKAFFEDWGEEYSDENNLEEGQCFWIVVEGKKIGQVNSNKIDQHNKRVELDIIIGPKKYMNQGYGPEALRLLIKYLFDNFDLHKVWIDARANNPRANNPRANNPRAIKAYEKAGFIQEGLLREHDRFESKWVDCVRLGILKEEYEFE